MKRNILLIIDDSELDRAILNEIFKKEYHVVLFSDPGSALEFIGQHNKEIAAAIVDVNLAKNDSGIVLLKKIHGIENADSIPVVLITSDAHENVVVEGMECGAIDFLVKPVNPMLVQARVRNIVASAWPVTQQEGNKEASAASSFGSSSISLDEAEQVARRWQAKLTRMCQYRNFAFIQSIEHIRMLTQCIISSYRNVYPDCDLDYYNATLIEFACAFADIGQLSLPDYIALAGLDQEEPGRSIFRRHTVMGGDLFEHVPSQWEPLATYCREIALYHHEEYDGSGFPAHLSGDAIPLSAQIVHAAMLLDTLFRQFALNQDAVECIFLKLEQEEKHRISPAMHKAIRAAEEQLETIRILYRNARF